MTKFKCADCGNITEDATVEFLLDETLLTCSYCWRITKVKLHIDSVSIGDVLTIIDNKRMEVLKNPSDPGWTEHFHNLDNEIKELLKGIR